VRGSRSGRPVMALLDMLGRRWTLRIGWELRGGAMQYGELRMACGEISTSVLAQRLAELTAAGIVTRNNDGAYALTRDGVELVELLAPLDRWAKRWARRGSM
jgi:DNA-binding HxlR family transcriptional regulator